MIRPIVQSESGDTCTILQLATHGINFMLDYLSTHLKLEFVSLVSKHANFIPFLNKYTILSVILFVLGYILINL